MCFLWLFFFFSSRRRHTRFDCDWSSDVCSSDLPCVAASPCSHGLIAPKRWPEGGRMIAAEDRKSTRLNSSHSQISYAVFCLKKKSSTPVRATTPASQGAGSHSYLLRTSARVLPK